MGSVGSVHFWIVPWSSLYFSRSIGPSYVVGTNDRVSIYCTCHFQGSSLFVLAASVCWSRQCLISALTQGGGGGHSFRLSGSAVLCGGRNTANK